MELDDKSLQILACDISVRPENAAGVADVLPFILTTTINDPHLVISFERDCKHVIESFVAAERLCCTGLNWDLIESEDALKLVVTGTSEQLAVCQQWFKQE